MATTAARRRTTAAPTTTTANGKPGELAGAAKGTVKLLDAVPLALIEAEPDFNPRQEMDAQELEDLASSLVLHGMLQPLLLRPKPGVKAGEGFYLTGGHRRYAAAKLANLKTVPAILRGTGDALVAAVLDNSHRVDLTPLEEALVYARAMREKGLTVTGVAEVLSLPQRRVTERLRILDLPENARPHVGTKLPLSWVGFYADTMQASPVLATAIAGVHIEAGQAPSIRDVQQIVKSTRGVWPPHVELGSKGFKLTSDEVKAAITTLEKSAGDWTWHGCPLQLDYKGASYKASRLRIESEELEQGMKIGAVHRFGDVDEDGYGTVAYAILDQKWLQETGEKLILTAAKAYEAHLKRRRSTTSSSGGKKDAELTEAEQAERAKRKREREKTERERLAARESNTQLGIALITHMGEVDPNNIDAIRAVCLALLQPYSSYGAGRDVGDMVGSGLRYVFPDWKNTVTTKGGKTKIELETDRKALDQRFWKWFDEAKTPAQVLGRTLITLTAMWYADDRECLSKERLYGGSGSLHGLQGAASPPGHDDVRTHLERLFDKHAPAARQRRKKAQGTPAQTSKTLAEVLDDVVGALDDVDAGHAAIELTDDQRAVIVALHTHRGGGRYGCNGEREVYQKLQEDTRITGRGAQKRMKDAVDGLRAQQLVGGVKAAPFLNKAYEDLAKALSLAKASREGGDQGIAAEVKRQAEASS